MIQMVSDVSNGTQLINGVLQGNILSPTLYIIYANDMPIAGPGWVDIKYADDIRNPNYKHSKQILKYDEDEY